MPLLKYNEHRSVNEFRISKQTNSDMNHIDDSDDIFSFEKNTINVELKNKIDLATKNAFFRKKRL